MDASLPHSLRLGDPLRREFLDDLRRRADLPGLLAAEGKLTDADLVVAVAVAEDSAELVLAAGATGGPRRWVLRQSLVDFSEGDLVDAFTRDFLARGHDAESAHANACRASARLVSSIGAAMRTMARLRPESGSLLRNLAQPLTGVSLEAGEPSVAAPARPRPEPAATRTARSDRSGGGGGSQPSRRRPGVDVEPPPNHRPSTAPPAPTAPRPPARRGTRVAGRALGGVAFIGVLAAVTVVALNAPTPARDPSLPASDASGGSEALEGVATPAPAAVSDYAVSLRNADGSAVRLEPCHTYDYVVQPGSLAPELAAAEAGAGFAALEEATGVAFRFGGYTTDRFPFPIDPDQPARQPILVSFEHPDDSRALVEGADAHLVTPGQPLGGLALAGPAVARPGFSVLVGGAVVVNDTLDATQRARVLLHELGHVAGLDHAANASQIMASPVPDTGPTVYRAGDRAGLAELRHDGCLLTDAERESVFA